MAEPSTAPISSLPSSRYARLKTRPSPNLALISISLPLATPDQLCPCLSAFWRDLTEYVIRAQNRVLKSISLFQRNSKHERNYSDILWKILTGKKGGKIHRDINTDQWKDKLEESSLLLKQVRDPGLRGSYLKDSGKAEMYSLSKENPKEYTIERLAKDFCITRCRVEAILVMKELQV